jgi:hypothetical protein
VIDADVEAATEQINEEMKTSLMLVLANRGRFETLRDDLANKYVLGDDKYPTSVEGLMGVLRNYKPPKNAPQPPRDPRGHDSEGLQFIQKNEGEETDEGAIMAQEKKVLGGEKKIKFNSKGEKDCFKCDADDHWADDCPQAQEKRGRVVPTNRRRYDFPIQGQWQ